MEPRELLQALMSRSGESEHALAVKLKRPSLQSQLNRFLNNIVREPRRTTLQPVADYYEVPIEAFYDASLAASTARRLRLDEPGTSGSVVVRESGRSFDLSQELPAGSDLIIRQYGTGGAMGAGVLLRDQPGMINSWHVTPEWIQKNVPNVTSPKNLAIVTGFGDSMRPLYNPGDPLLVDTGVKSVDFDGIYFFRVENEGFIKRLQRIPGIGLRAISENKAYESWDIKEGMDFEVFARVVKVWRGDEF